MTGGGRGYSATWHDGELLRVIEAASFRETWTQYDPELVERDYLPKERRRELVKVRPWVKRKGPWTSKEPASE